MSLSEFEIISRYFNQSGLASAPDDSNIPLGIGDDCALIKVPQQHRLAVSMDLLCAGVHFPREAAPDDIATRALAVNLSDLAAMGATPAGFTLGLSLPVCEPVWLESFSEGLKHLAQRYRCPLIGGDITRGESLVIAIQVHGYVHEDFALYRHGARPGDLVYVTGVLGNAGIGLRMIENQEFGRELTSEAAAQLNRCYYAPIPRVEFGKRIKAVTSCIDISDGLLADLGHIAGQSRVGMSIRQAAIPVSAAAIQLLGKAQAQNFALSCGDDYELAFTVPAAQVAVMEKAAAETGTIVTCIGKVTEGDSLICLDAEDKPVTVGVSGYQHF